MREKQSYHRVVILGGGESGIGAALLAAQKGYEVFVSDSAQLQATFRSELQGRAIDFEEGKHTESKILSADVIIKSPGLPPTVPILQAARKASIEIISEIEWASRFTTKTLIGITGTNGKTTTTSLIGHLLKSAGRSVAICGNIGRSFARAVTEEVPESTEIYVVEMSSFQLEDIDQLKANYAVLLNITPDHLDRYEGSFDEYAQAKLNLCRNADARSAVIYNADDVYLIEQIEKLGLVTKHLSFSIKTDAMGACIDGDDFKVYLDNKVYDKLPVSHLQIPGPHNQMNAMAALIIGKQLGLSGSELSAGLSSFQAVSHRMELVGTGVGLRFINDSKATNVASTLEALKSFDGPLVWIAGGIDKGNDYSKIAHLVKERVQTLVCLGEHVEQLEAAFKSHCQFLYAASMQEAVDLAVAEKGEAKVVLLSPACASFDLFRNYEDRGDQFREAVKKYSDAK
ncbi:MAG: UDP-N-acetylmuramoyl-L-alanine--D-glutamate ligase [Cyclobacteriaceae bacterium]|nr:UDP-N-acetylmuramoyl-L-alanine--D-glutamate ligase [Cyclobacteriaceae bacterium]MCH8516253.1 UDP-N-acetylmuramoyl-L-alanine--D-glutamate ligase [Cyclobacteriaceae bacterium]